MHFSEISLNKNDGESIYNGISDLLIIEVLKKGFFSFLFKM